MIQIKQIIIVNPIYPTDELVISLRNFNQCTLAIPYEDLITMNSNMYIASNINDNENDLNDYEDISFKVQVYGKLYNNINHNFKHLWKIYVLNHYQ